MRSFIASVAVFVALSGYPALAEESASQEPTRIEIDQTTKTFTFIIDNKPVALLDQEGLHVRGGIVYGGTLTDAGTSHFDEKVGRLAQEVAHD